MEPCPHLKPLTFPNLQPFVEKVLVLLQLDSVVFQTYRKEFGKTTIPAIAAARANPVILK